MILNTGETRRFRIEGAQSRHKVETVVLPPPVVWTRPTGIITKRSSVMVKSSPCLPTLTRPYGPRRSMGPSFESTDLKCVRPLGSQLLMSTGSTTNPVGPRRTNGQGTSLFKEDQGSTPFYTTSGPWRKTRDTPVRLKDTRGPRDIEESTYGRDRKSIT